MGPSDKLFIAIYLTVLVLERLILLQFLPSIMWICFCSGVNENISSRDDDADDGDESRNLRDALFNPMSTSSMNWNTSSFNWQYKKEMF